jgi:hypothetical protein
MPIIFISGFGDVETRRLAAVAQTSRSPAGVADS